MVTVTHTLGILHLHRVCSVQNKHRVFQSGAVGQKTHPRLCVCKLVLGWASQFLLILQGSDISFKHFHWAVPTTKSPLPHLLILSRLKTGVLRNRSTVLLAIWFRLPPYQYWSFPWWPYTYSAIITSVFHSQHHTIAHSSASWKTLALHCLTLMNMGLLIPLSLSPPFCSATQTVTFYLPPRATNNSAVPSGFSVASILDFRSSIVFDQMTSLFDPVKFSSQ